MATDLEAVDGRILRLKSQIGQFRDSLSRDPISPITGKQFQRSSAATSQIHDKIASAEQELLQAQQERGRLVTAQDMRMRKEAARMLGSGQSQGVERWDDTLARSRATLNRYAQHYASDDYRARVGSESVGGNGSEAVRKNPVQSGELTGTNSHKSKGAATPVKSAEKFEILAFTKRGSSTLAKQPFSDNALLNTYSSMRESLAQLRASVQQQGDSVTAKSLKTSFRGTVLSRAASDEQWVEWIEQMRRPTADQRFSPGNAAYVLLADTTGLTLRTVIKKCSEARRTPAKSKVTTGKKQ